LGAAPGCEGARATAARDFHGAGGAIPHALGASKSGPPRVGILDLWREFQLVSAGMDRFNRINPTAAEKSWIGEFSYAEASKVDPGLIPAPVQC
jgi:hypothetical protein